MDGTQLRQIKDYVRNVALEYITPGGSRKVVRRPKTDVPCSEFPVPFKNGCLSTRSWGEGETILLVHGWAATQTDMFAYVPALVERGFKIVAMDLPAHGESSFETAGLNHLAEGVSTVANHYGPIYGVIAHSVGCAATQVAIAEGMSVGKAAMLASPTDYERKAYEFAALENFSTDETEDFMRALADLDVRVKIRSTDFVPSFEIPALIVHSADDAVIPFTVGEELAQLWRGSKFIRCENLNHRGVLKDKDVICKVVDFFTENP